MESKKPGLNMLIIVGLFINMCCGFSFLFIKQQIFGNATSYYILFFVMMGFWTISVIGAYLILAGSSKTGSRLVKTGSLLFFVAVAFFMLIGFSRIGMKIGSVIILPIVMLPFIGARRVSNELETDSFKPAPVAISHVIVILVLIFSELWLGNYLIKYVPNNHSGIVYRLGAYHRATPSGLQMIIPFIETIRNLDTTVKLKQSEPYLVTTSDMNLIQISWIIQYAVQDPKRFLIKGDEHSSILTSLFMSNISSALGRIPFNNIIRDRNRIQFSVLSKVQNTVNELDLGLKIMNFEITKSRPPKPIRSHYSNISLAEQKKIMEHNHLKHCFKKKQMEAQTMIQRWDTKAKTYPEKLNRITKKNLESIEKLVEQFQKVKGDQGSEIYVEALNDMLSKIPSDFENITSGDESIKGGGK